MKSTLRIPFVSLLTLVMAVCLFVTGQQRANAAEDDSFEAAMQRAVVHIRAREFVGAIEDLDTAIKHDAEQAVAYYYRGRVRFQLGRIKKSVADFDKYVSLRPSIESRQWERGIAMYYADQFKRGADQFELYQTFHDNDVENSVWRFLCMTPEVGVKKSREVMLPIKNDPRIPMMKIFEMYRGTATPQDVLDDAKRGDPSEETLKGRLFYAHLYLGLFYEVTGKEKEAAKYIKLAADKSLAGHPGINSYMWDVARIHEMKMNDKLKVTKDK
ncbi:MAG: hypothetical protein MK006_04375 [Pirellulales bacterium]|nr:hypothetical protein [Pirellulales bacterium]